MHDILKCLGVLLLCSNIKVSIICNTYNHEDYIRNALDGFVMQKTSFAFEVLIHDDASTDSTADIIREYEQKYPHLIKPIYQTVNQYSKGVSITRDFQLSRVKGKYFALCEGDDYWTDPYKLQKQFDAMESHSEIDICANKSQRECNGILVDFIAPKNIDTIIPVEDVILGGGGYVATNSLFFRTEAMLDCPPFAQMLEIDYVWQIQASLRGGMLYLNDCMSIYRISVSGSWTEKMRADFSKKILHNQLVEKVLNSINEYTNFKYSDVIKQKIIYNKFSLLKSAQNSGVFLEDGNKIFKELPLKYKLNLLLRAIAKKCGVLNGK